MLSALSGPGNDAKAPVISREFLETAPRRFILKARINKADVYAVEVDGLEIAIKDYHDKPWWVRLFGRFQVAHEARAYRWLGGRRCIPRFFGQVDRDALATEVITGGELKHHPDRFKHRRRHLHGIRTIVECFRDAGFLHLDARGIHNVLVRSEGDVVFIDLAGSVWVRPGSRLHRLVEPFLRRFYLEVLKKWRKRLSPTRTRIDDRSTAYKILEYLRMPHHFFARRSGRRGASPDKRVLPPPPDA